MNSETRMPAPPSRLTASRDQRLLTGDIEPAFGGALGTPFRHQARGMRPGADRNRDHVVGRRHLEIQRLVDLGLEPHDVVVADMAAVFAQMRGDAVGAGSTASLAARTGSGWSPTPRVADGRDMIDVHAQTQEEVPAIARLVSRSRERRSRPPASRAIAR